MVAKKLWAIIIVGLILIGIAGNKLWGRQAKAPSTTRITRNTALRSSKN